jgi:co-chaperonin GroES (HSP10)
MELIAVNSSLILKKIKEKETGILLAEVDSSAIKAKVISIGPNVQTCKVDDFVLFLSNFAHSFEIEEDKYYVIDENKLLCIIRGQEQENNETES